MGHEWRAYEPPRFSIVPWLLDSADLRKMGAPESSVEIGNHDLTLGLYIPHPFGRDTDAMLSIHAMTGNGNDGGTITLAITSQVVRREDAEPVRQKPLTKASFYPPQTESD